MSLNTAMNAVIAFLEDRTDLVKEIVRGPNSDIKSTPEVMARLSNAVAKAQARGINRGLKETLSITPGKDVKNVEDFYKGVTAVETFLEHYASNLYYENGLGEED